MNATAGQLTHHSRPMLMVRGSAHVGSSVEITDLFSLKFKFQVDESMQDPCFGRTTIQYIRPCSRHAAVGDWAFSNILTDRFPNAIATVMG